MEVHAHGKINWFLEVLGKRPDGYHDIVTVMQKIAWCDVMRFSSRPDGRIVLRCNDPSLPTDDANLVVKAAKLLASTAGVRVGADIELEKHLPTGAGLGGGSSDAAATLLTLDRLWGLNMPPATLAAAAAKLGSDVPFFLGGVLARCEGRGEIVTPLENATRIPLVVVWPGQRCPTAQVYTSRHIDLTSPRQKCNFCNDLILGQASGHGVSQGVLFNRLRRPCKGEFPFVREMFQRIAPLIGAKPMELSGSGSACFVVCSTDTDAQTCAAILQREFSAPCRVVATSTLVENSS